MNRIIKFRVWDSELKIWIWNIGMKSKNVLCNGTEKRFHIMQFTGFNDKNGIEIYEGDICRVIYYNHSSPDSIFIQEVLFENGTFILKSKNYKDLELEDSRLYVPLYYSNPPNKIEVIGNIYENIELFN